MSLDRAAIAEALERWLILGVAALGVVLVHPICDLVFRCGCTLFSAEHCNVHAHHGPACPWCTSPIAFPGAVASWVLVSGAGVWLARRTFGRRLLTTAIGALLGFAGGVLLSGAITAWVTDYPRFLVP